MSLLRKFVFHRWFLLSLILASALFLRLYRIDVLMRFIWDEGRDMTAIRTIIVDKDITLFGPFNEMDGKKDFFGVFHYYLLLPSLYLANFNPVGPAIFTALLGGATVALAYYWLSKWTTTSIALASSALLAVSPLVVRYTQWPWNPNTTGFFMMLYLITTYWYQKSTDKSKKVLFSSLAGLLLGLLFQLHYFAVAGGVIFLAIFLKQKKKDWLSLMSFTLMAILPNLTFIIFDLTHQGFYRKILAESLFGKTSQNFVDISLLQILFGPLSYFYTVSKTFLVSAFLGLVVTLVGFVYLVKESKTILQNFTKNEYLKESHQLLLSWIFFLGMTSIFLGLLDDYHSASLWIGLAVLAVILIKRFFKKFWLFFFIPLIIFLFFANRFWRIPLWSENMPQVQRVGEIIAQDAQEDNESMVNVASFVDSDTRATRFRYFIELNGQTLEHYDQYPNSQVLYVITPHDWQETKQNPAWELDSFREATPSVLLEDEWSVIKLSK